MTLVNARVILNKLRASKDKNEMPLKKFLHSVCKDMAAEGGVQINDSDESDDDGELSRLKARHFPSYIPPTEKKDKPTRTCVVCSAKEKYLRKTNQQQKTDRKRKETSFECRKCGVPLCVAPCFEAYHTEQNYFQ